MPWSLMPGFVPPTQAVIIEKLGETVRAREQAEALAGAAADARRAAVNHAAWQGGWTDRRGGGAARVEGRDGGSRGVVGR